MEIVRHEISLERLARAAAHIDAVDLTNGRYAHYADETSSWWVVSADELEELCDYLESDDPAIVADAYSHWCAGTLGVEQPKGWTPDNQRTDARTYTYTIFDGDPNSSSGTEWPTHAQIEIEADSVAEACEEVESVMSIEASGLNACDGYSAGDVLNAILWDANGVIVGTPSYTLTDDDMPELD